MKISLLPQGKLSVAYEAYLSSLGISTRNFVLTGETMDLPELSLLPRLGVVKPTRLDSLSEKSSDSRERRRKTTTQPTRL